MATEKNEICKAIQSQKQIVYTCIGEKHVAGDREGNPHILYQSKNGHVLVHIWKTGGVQTDPSGVLPGWRSYHLSDIQLSQVGDSFETEESFNIHGKPYRNATIICSV